MTFKKQMKPLKNVIWLVLIFGFIGCAKNGDDAIKKTDVELYIDLLKSGRYDSLNLPAFSYTHIPALLEYRNDTQTITDFPNNPLSSMYMTECKLGMYALWTIESIRAASVESENLFMRFPSLNPVLALKDADELELVFDDESHSNAAQAYYNWWWDDDHYDFDDFKYIDPLGGTNYKWH